MKVPGVQATINPPNGDDGHGLFTRAPELWQPRLLEFLRANGYARAP
jgi:hypothetical protein